MLNQIARSLRSLTMSPFDAILAEAHRMARRHLEAGGAVAAPDGGDNRQAPVDFVLPREVSPSAMLRAIEAALQGRRTGLGDLLQVKANGRIVVPGQIVERLGDGDAVRGRRFLERVVANLRARQLAPICCR